MARIKSRDTRPELIVRKYLFARGYRYRKNVKGLPGTPDIVLRKYGIVIFVHGCFWHGHEHEMKYTYRRRIVNSGRKRLERNKARDAENRKKLTGMGWVVITLWECQLKPAVRDKTLLELEYLINHSYLERFSAHKVKPYGNIAKRTAAVSVWQPSRMPTTVVASDGSGFGMEYVRISITTIITNRHTSRTVQIINL